MDWWSWTSPAGNKILRGVPRSETWKAIIHSTRQCVSLFSFSFALQRFQTAINSPKFRITRIEPTNKPTPLSSLILAASFSSSWISLLIVSLIWFQSPAPLAISLTSTTRVREDALPNPKPWGRRFSSIAWPINQHRTASPVDLLFGRLSVVIDVLHAPALVEQVLAFVLQLFSLLHCSLLSHDIRYTTVLYCTVQYLFSAHSKP